MGLVSTNQPNLINGVSQQADSLKFATQAVEQINGYSSVVDGLIKRNPSIYVNKLTSSTSYPFVHTINRDSTERYQVLITHQTIRVFDIDGNERTVLYGDYLDYINTATTNLQPQDYSSYYLKNRDPLTMNDTIFNASDFKALTIADYTLILNKSVVPQMLSYSSSDPQKLDGTIMVLQSASNVSHTVQITVTSPSTSVTQSVTATGAVSTATAAENIKDAITTNTPLNGANGVTVTRYGSVLYIVPKRTDADSISINVTDTVGNTYTKAACGSATSIASLPTSGVNGQLIKITGGTNTSTDDFWVKFQTDGGSTSGTGKWVETVAPSTPLWIDSKTMPHALIRLSDGRFLFTRLTSQAGSYMQFTGGGGFTTTGTPDSFFTPLLLPYYKPRRYGTLDSNPNPSFIGQKINDMTLFRSRLAFATGENVVLSEANEFFSFFRTSLQSLLDADPIDVAVTSTKVSTIYNLVPFSDKLLLFGDQTQFSLTSADVLTPKTVSIQQTTEFTNDRNAKPALVGKTVHFPFIRGSYTGLMEYYVSPLTSLFDGIDITASVPKYIKGTIKKIASNSNEQVNVILGSDNRLYIYKYFYNGEEKIQSAWSKWTLPTRSIIHNIDFIDSTLYLVVGRPDGIFLEKINFESGFGDNTGEYVPTSIIPILLDRRVFYTQNPNTGVNDGCVYSASTNLTTITLPYSYYGRNNVVKVVGGYATNVVAGNVNNFGVVYKVTQQTGTSNYTTVTVEGDLTGTDFFLGLQYELSYQFSTPLIRASNGQGRTSITDGRLQVKTGNLTYNNSLYFTVDVTPEGRSTYTYTFNGPKLGTAALGSLTPTRGAFRFPVMAKNDMVSVTLRNSSPFPCALLSMDWESWYQTRNQRLG